MSFHAIQNYLVDLFRSFTLPNDGTKKVFDHVTISDQSPLAGINSLCIIMYEDRLETTPLGYGSEEQRFHRTEWIAKIHLMFMPDKTGAYNRFSAEAQNKTISERIAWVQDQLAAYRTLQGYSNFVFEPGGNRDRYSNGINNQIIDTEPTYNETPVPIQFGPPFGNYAGTVFTMKIIEVFHVPNQPALLPIMEEPERFFFFAAPNNDIMSVNLNAQGMFLIEDEDNEFENTGRKDFPIPMLSDNAHFLWFFQEEESPLIRNVFYRGGTTIGLFNEAGFATYRIAPTNPDDQPTLVRFRGYSTPVEVLQVMNGNEFTFSRR